MNIVENTFIFITFIQLTIYNYSHISSVSTSRSCSSLSVSDSNSVSVSVSTSCIISQSSPGTTSSPFSCVSPSFLQTTKYLYNSCLLEGLRMYHLGSDNCQLDCNQPSQVKAKPSQVKAKAGCKSATALPIHLLLSFLFLFLLFFLILILYIYNWTTSNASISVNSQPFWVKFWILHLMTNINKVYNTTPNLRKSQPQKISTNLKHFKCLISIKSKPTKIKVNRKVR